MSDEDIRVVREIYDAFDQGDMDGVFARLDEDIEWREPYGYFVSPGESRGHQAVKETLARYPEVWQEFALEPETFLAGDGHVIVTGRESGISRATGRAYRGRFANVWRVRGGKAQALEAFADTGLMWKALGEHPPD